MTYHQTEKLPTDYGKLLLLREVGQSVVIQKNIKILPFNISLNKVKFGIKCPLSVVIAVKIRESSDIFEHACHPKNEFIVIKLAQGDILCIGKDIKMTLETVQEGGGIPLSFVAPKNIEISRYELTEEGQKRKAARQKWLKAGRRINPDEEYFT